MPCAASKQFGPNWLPLMADINSNRPGKRRRDKSGAVKDPPSANLELKQLHLECINNAKGGFEWTTHQLVLIMTSHAKECINSISKTLQEDFNAGVCRLIFAAPSKLTPGGGKMEVDRQVQQVGHPPPPQKEGG